MEAIPFSPSELVAVALAQLVQTIAALGIPVTRDPGDFQPPAVLVAAPTITGIATMGTIGLSVPVYVVSDQAGMVGLDWMLDNATMLLDELGETTAEPTIYTSPINPAGLPAYLVTVRMNVGQPEGA